MYLSLSHIPSSGARVVALQRLDQCPIMQPLTDPASTEPSAAAAALGVLYADATTMPCAALVTAGLIHAGNTGGLVDALAAAMAADNAAVYAAADTLSAPQRHALLDYLLQPGSFEWTPKRVATITCLPLFQAAGPDQKQNDPRSFVRIDAGHWYAAPLDVPAAALPGDCFVVAPSVSSRPQLIKLGAADATLAAAYAAFVLPRLTHMSDSVVQQAMLQLLRKLPDVRLHDPGIVHALRSLEFVDTVDGRRAPSALYDPRVPQLQALLAGSAHFPAPPYDSDEVVATLSMLGLQRVVQPDTLLQAARHVEALAADDPQAARAQGHRLLQYLEVWGWWWVGGWRLFLCEDEDDTYMPPLYGLFLCPIYGHIHIYIFDTYTYPCMLRCFYTHVLHIHPLCFLHRWKLGSCLQHPPQHAVGSWAAWHAQR